MQHTGDGLTVSSRRRYFQVAAHRQALPFSTEYVWTFHLWQEYIDYASYMLNMGYSSYDLTQHLDGQPLQVRGGRVQRGRSSPLQGLCYHCCCSAHARQGMGV